MLEKTLTRVGGSHALIIDKAVLDLLGIGPDTRLQITTDGRRLVVTPVPDDRSGRVEQAMGEVLEAHAELFEKLAK